MSTRIDTHKIHSTLTQAGFEKEKADAVLAAVTSGTDGTVTNEDLERQILLLKKDLTIQQWAVATTIIAILSAIKFFG